MTFNVPRSEVFQALGQVRHPEIPSRSLLEIPDGLKQFGKGKKLFALDDRGGS